MPRCNGWVKQPGKFKYTKAQNGLRSALYWFIGYVVKETATCNHSTFLFSSPVVSMTADLRRHFYGVPGSLENIAARKS